MSNKQNLRKVTHASREFISIMLGVSPKSVTNWRDKEGLPFFREAGKIYYDCKDVHQWYVDREIRKMGLVKGGS